MSRKCPICESTNVRTIDSRPQPADHGNLVIRRFVCFECESRWATEETFARLIRIEGEKVSRAMTPAEARQRRADRRAQRARDRVCAWCPSPLPPHRDAICEACASKKNEARRLQTSKGGANADS